jgi:hypothetical protein
MKLPEKIEVEVKVNIKRVDELLLLIQQLSQLAIKDHDDCCWTQKLYDNPCDCGADDHNKEVEELLNKIVAELEVVPCENS